MFAALEDVLVEVDGLRHAEARVVARDVVLTCIKEKYQSLFTSQLVTCGVGG